MLKKILFSASLVAFAACNGTGDKLKSTTEQWKIDHVEIDVDNAAKDIDTGDLQAVGKALFFNDVVDDFKGLDLVFNESEIQILDNTGKPLDSYKIRNKKIEGNTTHYEIEDNKGEVFPLKLEKNNSEQAVVIAANNFKYFLSK